MTQGANPTNARPARTTILALALLAASLNAAPAPARAAPVDLELILAVDASYSVSEQEFALQIAGLAGAFHNPMVINAIEGVGPDGIAVTLVQWWYGGVVSAERSPYALCQQPRQHGGPQRRAHTNRHLRLRTEYPGQRWRPVLAWDRAPVPRPGAATRE